MKLEEKDKLLINDLINIAWATGNVKAPQMAQTVEDLRRKILAKEEDKKE